MSLSLSICMSTLSPSLSTTQSVSSMSQTIRAQHEEHQGSRGISISSIIAKPYMYRRGSGRYYYRLRPTGSVSVTASVSLGTTERTTAMKRYNHLSSTMKAFMLDKDSATFEELREHLKGIAKSFLNDKAEDYWSGVEVDHLSDAKSDLREIAATQALSDDQHRLIIEALSVLSAAQSRVDNGDALPLLNHIEALNGQAAGSTGVSASLLEVEQGDRPTGITDSYQYNSLQGDLLAEKRLTLKPASLKDLESTLKTVSKFVPEGADLMSRPQWLAIRDSMVSAGLAASTINKAMTKAKMLLDYGLMNNKLTGRNPIERLKLTGAESQRKAFSEAQLVALSAGLPAVANDNHRYLVALGLITGSRIGELTQLTPDDIKQVEGHWCIDINGDNGKTIKNKASARVVPLTDGAYGFNLEEFLAFVESCPKGKPILNMSRDTASKWFNENYMRATLSDHENVTFHSLRHSLASTLKAAGVSLTDAQGILGHSSQSITFDLYGRGHAVQRLAEALKVLVLK